MAAKGQKRKSNIVLIGYRGTGKTTIGKIVAEILKVDFISTDKLISNEMGMSISEAVRRYGWIKFREVESNIVKRVSSLKNCVIDCGGGIVERKENIAHLKKNGEIILFEAKTEDIINRIKNDFSRPPFKKGFFLEDEVEKMLGQRRKKYKEAADYTINTSNISIEEVAQNIALHLKPKAV